MAHLFFQNLQKCNLIKRPVISVVLKPLVERNTALKRQSSFLRCQCHIVPGNTLQSQQLLRPAACVHLGQLIQQKSSAKSDEGEIPSTIKKAAYKLLYVELEEDDKMTLSALFMQITGGPCNVPQPKDDRNSSKNNNAREMEYWQAWKKLGNMSREEAEKKYLQIAEKYLSH